MRLGLVFSDDQVQLIYNRAIDVVETIGLAVEDSGSRDRLLDQSGFALRGHRVVIERQVVEAALAARNAEQGIEVPSLRPAWDPADTGLSVGTHATHTVAPGADQVRPITTDDVIAGIRMVRALGDPHVASRTVGIPQDVPLTFQTAQAQMLSCVHAGRCAYTAVATDQQMAVDLAFHEAMGVDYALSVHLPCPLRVAGDEFRLALQWADRLSGISIGAMPQAGATAPASVPGLLIQAMAEMLGVNAAFRVLFPGLRINFNISAHSTNFQTGGMVFGSPGALLVETALFQVRGWLGCGWGGGRFMRTHAKLPGLQSAADKAAGAMMGMLLGSQWVSSGGYISMDEVWSPEQLLLDAEILSFVAKAAGDIATDDDAFDINVIRECVEGADYMSADDTVRRFRELTWEGRLFQYDMLGAWLQSDQRTDRQRLTDMIAELTSRDLPPALDDQRYRAVMAVYDQAKTAVG